MVQVYFATNRKPDPTQPGGFGADLVPYDAAAMTYAIADVPNPGSGQVGPLSEVATGQFSAAATQAIIGSGKSLLVFIHGFDNSFADAMSRAAFNAEWLRASGAPDTDTVAVAFTWPSTGRLFGAAFGPADAAYRADQAMAGASGYHLGHFFSEIDRLRALYRVRNPTGRIYLLAHSMGNWALQAAMTWWYQAQQPGDDMFDEVILAAADEVADTFEAPHGTRLSRIADLGKRVTIYYSRKDAVLWLSAAVNGNARLGHDGPEDKANARKYPISVFRMMDCTEVSDFPSPFLSEETHQYYRLSPTVRADIAAVMGGGGSPLGGLGQLPPPAV